MKANVRTGIYTTLLLAAGCGGNVTLDPPTFPEPLVDKIPVDVGLRMMPDMYGFEHEEDVLGKETWTINLGDASAKLFVDLFGHMFNSVDILTEDDDPAAMMIDALVETSIDGFEFSVPEQTGTNAFSVWIRYRLKVYNRDGDMVANWPVSAYGKSESRVLGGTASLEKAAILAMRDAAALMIMKLDQETGISALNTQNPAPAESAPAPATTAEATANNDVS